MTAIPGARLDVLLALEVIALKESWRLHPIGTIFPEHGSVLFCASCDQHDCTGTWWMGAHPAWQALSTCRSLPLRGSEHAMLSLRGRHQRPASYRSASFSDRGSCRVKIVLSRYTCVSHKCVPQLWGSSA